VVVVAVPAFVLLFLRIQAYYARTAASLGLGDRPMRPEPKPTRVIVPVSSVSRLTEHALCEALSLGQDVIAVTVVLAEVDDVDHRAVALADEWAQWDPGVPLQVLTTEYASVVEPLVDFIEEVRGEGDAQVVVLIPVVIPTRARYRILHNQIDVVLSAALRNHDDVVVARVGLSVASTDTPAEGSEAEAPAPSVPSEAPSSSEDR
jgi:hypothetical protein